MALQFGDVAPDNRSSQQHAESHQQPSEHLQAAAQQCDAPHVAHLQRSPAWDLRPPGLYQAAGPRGPFEGPDALMSGGMTLSHSERQQQQADPQHPVLPLMPLAGPSPTPHQSPFLPQQPPTSQQQQQQVLCQSLCDGPQQLAALESHSTQAGPALRGDQPPLHAEAYQPLLMHVDSSLQQQQQQHHLSGPGAQGPLPLAAPLNGQLLDDAHAAALVLHHVQHALAYQIHGPLPNPLRIAVLEAICLEACVSPHPYLSLCCQRNVVMLPALVALLAGWDVARVARSVYNFLSLFIMHHDAAAVFQPVGGNPVCTPSGVCGAFLDHCHAQLVCEAFHAFRPHLGLPLARCHTLACGPPQLTPWPVSQPWHLMPHDYLGNVVGGVLHPHVLLHHQPPCPPHLMSDSLAGEASINHVLGDAHRGYTPSPSPPLLPSNHVPLYLRTDGSTLAGMAAAMAPTTTSGTPTQHLADPLDQCDGPAVSDWQPSGRTAATYRSALPPAMSAWLQNGGLDRIHAQVLKDLSSRAGPGCVLGMHCSGDVDFGIHRVSWAPARPGGILLQPNQPPSNVLGRWDLSAEGSSSTTGSTTTLAIPPAAAQPPRRRYHRHVTLTNRGSATVTLIAARAVPEYEGTLMLSDDYDVQATCRRGAGGTRMHHGNSVQQQQQLSACGVALPPGSSYELTVTLVLDAPAGSPDQPIGILQQLLVLTILLDRAPGRSAAAGLVSDVPPEALGDPPAGAAPGQQLLVLVRRASAALAVDRPADEVVWRVQARPFVPQALLTSFSSPPSKLEFDAPLTNTLFGAASNEYFVSSAMQGSRVRPAHESKGWARARHGNTVARLAHEPVLGRLASLLLMEEQSMEDDIARYALYNTRVRCAIFDELGQWYCIHECPPVFTNTSWIKAGASPRRYRGPSVVCALTGLPLSSLAPPSCSSSQLVLGVLDVPGLIERTDRVLVGDVVYLRPASSPQEEYAAQVLATEQGACFLVMPQAWWHRINPLTDATVAAASAAAALSSKTPGTAAIATTAGTPISEAPVARVESASAVTAPPRLAPLAHVYFTFDRTALSRMFNTLATAGPKLKTCLPPQGKGAGSSAPCSPPERLSQVILDQKVIYRAAALQLLGDTPLNHEQRLAIAAMLCGAGTRLPFVLFGPPGTGKTVTLVECVLQLLEASRTRELPSGTRLLLCAPQNYSADLICAALAAAGVGVDAQRDGPDLPAVRSRQVHPSLLAAGTMLRLNDPRRPRAQAHPAVLAYSPWEPCSGMFCVPKADAVRSAQVVVSTCAFAGALITANSSHGFTHLMVDEAGQATVPEVLIPLAVLRSELPGGVAATRRPARLTRGSAFQVMLCGDPKQLGPVVRNASAAAAGLGQSLLECILTYHDNSGVLAASLQASDRSAATAAALAETAAAAAASAAVAAAVAADAAGNATAARPGVTTAEAAAMTTSLGATSEAPPSSANGVAASVSDRPAVAATPNSAAGQATSSAAATASLDTSAHSMRTAPSVQPPSLQPPAVGLVTPAGHNLCHVVMLRRNYRSAPALLQLPSSLFYDRGLIAAADPAAVMPPRWKVLDDVGDARAVGEDDALQTSNEVYGEASLYPAASQPSRGWGNDHVSADEPGATAVSGPGAVPPAQAFLEAGGGAADWDDDLPPDISLEAAAESHDEETRWSGLNALFIGVAGQQVQEGDMASYYNPQEATTVAEYVADLLAGSLTGSGGRDVNVTTDDIGVICMYRKQVVKLRLLLRERGLGAVRVGTVDDYQGQEARVVFISTVLSRKESLPANSGAASEHEPHQSFWSNAKRFNVAITRAKALLVVVGSPLVLVEDDNWKRMLAFCINRGGYRGFGLSSIVDDLNGIAVPADAQRRRTASHTTNGASQPGVAASGNAEEDERSETRTALRRVVRQALLGSGYLEQQEEALGYSASGYDDDMPFRVAM